jgi:hypothetical protein
MSVGIMLLVLGCVVVAWAAWVLPRQLRRARVRMSQARRIDFDARFARRGLRLMLRLPSIMGGALVVIGLALLLSE